MFLRSLVILNNSVSVRILPPYSGAVKKKSLRHKLVLFQLGISKFCSRIHLITKTQWSLPYSSSISVWNFEFLVAKWVLLAKKSRGPDIFRPLQCQTRGGGDPRLPEIDASGLSQESPPPIEMPQRMKTKPIVSQVPVSFSIFAYNSN